jgi:hypothetical protein
MEPQKEPVQVELVVKAFAQRKPEEEDPMLKDPLAKENAEEPALPVSAMDCDDEGKWSPIETMSGFTKREEIALRCMAMLVSPVGLPETCAKRAYDYADAFLQEGLRREREESFPAN